MTFEGVRIWANRYQGHAMTVYLVLAILSWYATPLYVLSHFPALKAFTDFMEAAIVGLDEVAQLRYPSEWLRFWICFIWLMSLSLSCFLLVGAVGRKILREHPMKTLKAVGVLLLFGLVIHFGWACAMRTPRGVSVVQDGGGLAALMIGGFFMLMHMALVGSGIGLWQLAQMQIERWRSA